MRDVDGNPIGLTPKEVAARLSVDMLTLARWRKERMGPSYYRIHKLIYYKPEDISAWIAGNRVSVNE